MLEFIRLTLKIAMTAILFPLRIFPIINNRVLLLNNILNFDAKYACNTKYLAEYLLKTYPGKFEIIYPLGKDIDAEFLRGKGVVVTRLGSLRYYYYALTSKFFVTTSGAISYMPFRKKQIVINTWHGGGAYKKMGLDINNNRFYRYDCMLTEKKTTYFLSSNRRFSEIIKSSLLMPTEKILEIGLPRNDLFFTDYTAIHTQVKHFYKIDQDTKIILYAPTYRTPGENAFLKHALGPYQIDHTAIIQALERRFGGKWVFALRLHPSVEQCLQTVPEGVINMSGYDDIQELFCAADILINDYSSTMWDFVQMRKPCFIYSQDLEQYAANRGFYTDPTTWPFPLATTEKALITNIDKFNEQAYQLDVQRYFDLMNNFENGTASEKVGEIMLNSLYTP